MTLPNVEIPSVGIRSVAFQGVTWVNVDAKGHEHDYIGNWLWDDGTCILWDDGAVMAL